VDEVYPTPARKLSNPRKIRVCDHCSAEFWPKSPRKSRRFCSRRCSGLSRTPAKGTTNAGSFPKGQAPWNAGLAGYRAGTQHSAETRRKIGESNRARHPNPVTPEHTLIRKSSAYKAWRIAVFQRDNYTCQICATRSVAGKRLRLNADHILPFAQYPENRFDVDNGRTLCEPCHRKTPTYGNGAKAFTGGKAVRGE